MQVVEKEELVDASKSLFDWQILCDKSQSLVIGNFVFVNTVLSSRSTNKLRGMADLSEKYRSNSILGMIGKEFVT